MKRDIYNPDQVWGFWKTVWFFISYPLSIVAKSALRIFYKRGNTGG